MFAVDHGVRAANVGVLAWDRGGAYIAGTAIAAAGLYELTPLKRACLRRCRMMTGDVTGPTLLTGLRYGTNCVGCCGGLMLVLFAVGVMSVFWMAAIAVLVFIQKVPTAGSRSLAPIALLLLGVGAWVVLATSSVPGLTLPM